MVPSKASASENAKIAVTVTEQDCLVVNCDTIEYVICATLAATHGMDAF